MSHIPIRTSPKPEKKADPYAVQEITLYILNNSGLYFQMYQPIAKNFACKIVRGTYDPQRAVKGVIYMIDVGIQKYRREFGMVSAQEYGLGPGISMTTKVAAAKIVLSSMTESIWDEVKRIRQVLKIKRR